MSNDANKNGCLKIIFNLIGLVTLTPAWLFIVYSLLKASNVDDIVWLVFYFYCPGVLAFGLMRAGVELLLTDE